MRLTKKGEYSNYEPIKRSDLYQAIDKLGQLEDLMEKYDFDSIEQMDEYLRLCKEYIASHGAIEKELGIELTTLFKALNDGFYFKSRDSERIRYTRRYLKPLLCAYYQKIEIQEYVDNAGGYWYKNTDDYVRLCDYGKTWALTKEELE